jgi:hypothetical protein
MVRYSHINRHGLELRLWLWLRARVRLRVRHIDDGNVRFKEKRWVAKSTLPPHVLTTTSATYITTTAASQIHV